MYVDFRFVLNIAKHSTRVKGGKNKIAIIILASGTQERWKGEGLKQLSLINNVPLIERTLDQLDNKAVVITVHRELMKYPYYIPSGCRWTVETFLSTQSLWGDRTIVLLGDVLYSEADLKTILDYDGDHSVFGSFLQGELFAFSFSHTVNSKILFHLKRVIFHAQFGGRGKLWELYRSLVGLPLHWHRKRDHFVEISGSTDFDTYDEYKQYIHDGTVKKWSK